MKIARHFTSPSRPIADRIEWKKVSVKIEEKNKVVLDLEAVEVPKGWSQTAADILAHKYLRKAGVPSKTVTTITSDVMPDFLYPSEPHEDAELGSETSAKQVFHRLAGHWTYEAFRQGHISDEESAQAFYDELFWMLAHQFGAPNSPQWFNTGLWWAYGIEGGSGGAYRAPAIGEEAVEVGNAYAYPQTSACFILGLKDSLLGEGSILDTVTREARIFKYGSGSGVNYSSLRGKGVALKNGGSSSGLMSFLKLFDVNAGTIKSGGTTRRAARMVIVDADHPEAEDFVTWKAREEVKVAAMVAGANASKATGDIAASAIKALGAAEYEGEAYQTVSGQNANNSLRVTDEFMGYVEDEGVPENSRQKILWKKTVDAAWMCGDPGLQFHDTINSWHTIPKVAPQRATNPCQPEFATVLTKKGITTFGELNVGDVIWSGQQWTEVIRKVATGVKPVFEYVTSAGTFVGTDNHRVIEGGERVEAKDAERIDVSVGPDSVGSVKHFPSAIIDGLVLGDGSVVRANGGANTYIVLNIGHKDGDYFKDKSISEYIAPNVYDHKGSWETRRVDTSMKPEDLPRMWERRVPHIYYTGSRDLMASFLRGLYSANGAVVGNGKRVTLKTTSLQLAIGVQHMLSALGIPSYRTTTKPVEVEFSNGTYECKQSYDVNITRGRYAFRDLIGFIQLYKQEALNRGLEGYVQGNNIKNSYEVQQVNALGEHQVWDIEVAAKEHTYWTGGLLVSNCSEYSFIDNSSCNLASLNLVKFLSQNKRNSAGEVSVCATYFDPVSFGHACRLWTIVLDVSVGMSSYPDKLVAQNSVDYRAIGLGYANLGGLLMLMGVPYDSSEGRAYAGLVTACMHGEAWHTSQEMAADLGSFRDYKVHAGDVDRVRQRHSDAATELATGSVGRVAERDKKHPMHDLVERVQVLWREGGVISVTGFGERVRNAQLTLLAPTGTIGLVMDCATTGVEPDFSLVKFKKLAGGGSLTMTNPLVREALMGMGYTETEIGEIEEYIRGVGRVDMACPHIRREHMRVFDCAGDISVEGHIGMMAAVQPFLSGAISKTVNMPAEATVEDVAGAYLLAWKSGLKAVAIYRDGCKLSQPLTAVRADTAANQQNTAPDAALVGPASLKPVNENPALAGVKKNSPRYKLPSRRRGFTQKVKVGGQSLYIRTGEYGDGKLGEVFLNLGRDGSTMRHLLDSLAVTISLGLQHGVPLQEFVDAFVDTRSEPSGMVQGSDKVKFCSSLMDYIVRELSAEYLEREESVPDSIDGPPPTAVVAQDSAPTLTVVETPVRERPRLAVVGSGVSVGNVAVLDTSEPSAVESEGDNVNIEEDSNWKDDMVLPRILRADTKVSSEERTPGLRTLAAPRYNGNACPSCGNFTLRRSGSCHVCDSCGQTTGCS